MCLGSVEVINLTLRSGWQMTDLRSEAGDKSSQPWVGLYESPASNGLDRPCKREVRAERLGRFAPALTGAISR